MRARVTAALKRGEFSACRCQDSLYIFEQLVSRSFSTVRLTLTRSVTPSRGTLQSQLSAIRMRVITRHSWLLRSTSVPAKFPRASERSRGNFCRENEVPGFADAERLPVVIIPSVDSSRARDGTVAPTADGRQRCNFSTLKLRYVVTYVRNVKSNRALRMSGDADI